MEEPWDDMLPMAGGVARTRVESGRTRADLPQPLAIIPQDASESKGREPSVDSTPTGAYNRRASSLARHTLLKGPRV